MVCRDLLKKHGLIFFGWLWRINPRHYGFNGEKLVHTPVLDELAGNGVRFSNASVTAPVCSTARSALITGMFQTSIGAHHHRSGRGESKIKIPNDIKLIPELFQDAGYYTCLGSSAHAAATVSQKHKNRLGKSDYNFEWNPSVFDSAEWSGRKKGQPFFARFALVEERPVHRHGSKIFLMLMRPKWFFLPIIRDIQWFLMTGPLISIPSV